jgi:hypothetical protein
MLAGIEEHNMKILLGLSAMSGIVASGLWAWSAMVKQPSFEVLATFVADETGVAPSNRYLKKVSKLNAWAAGVTGISVLLGAVFSWMTS